MFGSRANQEKSNRDKIRKLLGLSFHLFVSFAGVKGIKDTQCGFKMFSRESAKWLFRNQHIERWCFDPELLLIGRKRNMEIAEEFIEWNEIEGSKMKFSGMIKMFIDLVQIAVYYRIGIWSVRSYSSDQH